MTDKTKIEGLKTVAWAFRSPINTVSKLQWKKPCMITPKKHGWRPLTYKSDAAAIISGKDAEIARLRAEVDRLETSLQAQCIACKWPSDCRAREEDVERLTKERDTEIARNKPLHALIKSIEETKSHLIRKNDEKRDAVSTLDSERSANEQLTNAIAQQAERIAELERERDEAVAHDRKAISVRNEAIRMNNETRISLTESIAAQSVALAKVREALEATIIGGPNDNMGVVALWRVREALAAIVRAATAMIEP